MDQGQLCTKAIYNDDEFTGLEGFRVELTVILAIVNIPSRQANTNKSS